MADVSELTKLGSAPIPGKSPVGTDSKYDTGYETLKTEIGKLETDPGSVQWREIVTLGTNLLQNKSKDLQIACYFTAALWNQQSYPGLIAGITIIKDMMNTYWDDLFPGKKRMRGRIGALDWISSRVEKMMPGKPAPTESDRDSLTTAHTAAQELETVINAKVGGNKTNISVLVRTVREQLEKIPKPKPKQEPKQEQAQQQPQPQLQQPAVPAQKPIDSPAAAKDALKEMTKTALKIATQLRNGEPTNPLGYRLLRTTLWSQIQNAGENPKGGDEGTLNTLEKKLKEKDFPGCIELAETKLVDMPLCLDLNFFTVRAMEGMGYTYDDAREAIGQEVAGLALRLPQLLEQKSKKGPHTCTSTTRLWITNELSVETSKKDHEGNGMGEAVSKAKKLVSRKKLADAITILDHGAKSAGDRREKFLWRLHLAELCVQGGKSNLAMPLLDSLNREVEKFCLEEWETGLASEVLKISVQCAKAGEDDASKSKANELYARLSSLDLSAALALDGN